MERRNKGQKIPRRAIVQLGTGLTLVTAAVVGVTLLVDGGAETTTIAFVDTDVGMGVSIEDIEVRFLEVPTDSSLFYWLGEEDWESLSETVTNRPLRKGDVVSRRDFSLPYNSDVTGIALDLSIGQPAWLTPGQRVTLWVAPPSSENSYSAPRVVSANVLIESVTKDDGFASDGLSRQVSVLVGSQDISDVLHALANRYFLTLVPHV